MGVWGIPRPAGRRKKQSGAFYIFGFLAFCVPPACSYAATLRRGSITGPVATCTSASIQAAIDAAREGCVFNANHIAIGQGTVDLPSGADCIMTAGLLLDTSCVNLRTNGATLDFSNAPANVVALTTTSENPYNPYNDNTLQENIKLIGPGPGAGSIGLLSESGGATYENLTAANFQYGFEVGNNSYVNHLINPQLLGNVTGFYCPPGLVDAGENESISGGTISNNSIGIDNEGCDEIRAVETSFDFNSQTDIVAATGGGGFGAVQLYLPHIEFTTHSGYIVDAGNASSNAWTHVVIDGGEIQADQTGSNISASVRNQGVANDGGWGPFVSIIGDIFIHGLSPTAPCAQGSDQTCSVGANASQVGFEARDQLGNRLLLNRGVVAGAGASVSLVGNGAQQVTMP